LETSRCGARFCFLGALAVTANEHEYLHGIALFNQGKFFDAHEVLEDVWRAAPHEEKKIWQGLIQVAVALHHYSTGNLVGMRSVLVRAMKNLSRHPRNFHGVEVSRLLQSLTDWLQAFDNNQPLPSLPQIDLANRS
jgi:predicted metal-dependent hydrolase